MSDESRNAVVLAPVATAVIPRPKPEPTSALRTIDTITRHLTGVIRALEDLKQELKK
jgi:hypothetical protein